MSEAWSLKVFFLFYFFSGYLKPIAAEERRIEEEERKVREEQERLAKLAEGSFFFYLLHYNYINNYSLIFNLILQQTKTPS